LNHKRRKSACPLCGSGHVGFFLEVRSRKYFRCETCRLTHLDPRHRLAPLEELERYRTHRNDPSDEGYRQFLSRLAQPLLKRLPEGAKGLDYGCGPGPTLSVMFEEKGHTMDIYDPFFAPFESVFSKTYDFITCSETAEHFFHPGVEFRWLNRMLRPEGWLGVMTQMQEDDEAFGNWHYLRDPTHVCFYRWHTMEWIAREHGWKMESPAENVILFQKNLPLNR